MAGRPVSVQGSSSGLLYGLITFAILTVIALALFILQFTGNQKLRSEAEGLRRQLAAAGQAPSYYLNEAQARGVGAVQVMGDDLRALATLISGNPEDLRPRLADQVQQTLVGVAAAHPGQINPGDTLLTVVGNLATSLRQARDQAESFQIVMRDLEADKESLTQQMRTRDMEFGTAVSTLGAQLQQAQQEKTTALGQKDQQLAALQREVDASNAQLQTLIREGNTRVRDFEILVGQRDTQIAALLDQIRQLKGPGALDPRSVLTKADGRIERAIPGSDIVYINLGSRDRVKAGMGFEVYSPTRGVSDSLRGHASLEVVTVMEMSAECRVTRRDPIQPILEGDTVVNIAYERNRKPKFVVRGDFDLDFDGNVDINGVDQVIAIIREWGGQVVEEIDESVDYVIVGVAPGGPDVAATVGASAAVREQAIQAELARSRYRGLIERAQKTGIPVITQNQFLYLMGYSGPGSVTP
ncbi:MAG: hypothetical protein IPM18_09645 [Phycisphaerales bacterium]|nr:hypothetical protein [Phycisphaerales bacterium]